MRIKKNKDLVLLGILHQKGNDQSSQDLFFVWNDGLSRDGAGYDGRSLISFAVSRIEMKEAMTFIIDVRRNGGAGNNVHPEHL